MAAKKLNELWNGWMLDLGRSYPKTLALLDQGKTQEAYQAYRTGCLAAVKKLYSESAKTYPLRFSKAETWCVWTKELYVMSLKIDKALKQKNVKLAEKLLVQMRMHFYALHKETQTLGANDWIYVFHTELNKDTPSIDILTKAVAQFKQAKPCLLAQNKDVETLYDQAKDMWLAAIEPLLKPDSLTTDSTKALQTATKSFYQAYGIQFE